MKLSQYLLATSTNMSTSINIVYDDEIITNFMEGTLPVPSASHYIGLVMNVPQERLSDIPDYDVPAPDNEFMLPLIESCVRAIQGDKDEYELLEYVNTIDKKVPIKLKADEVIFLTSEKIDKENLRNIIELQS